MKLKFLIATTRQVGGGGIVLHTLGKHLLELGYDVQMFYNLPEIYKKNKSYQYFIYWAWIAYKDAIKVALAKFLPKDIKYKLSFLNGYINPPVKNLPRKYLPLIDDETIVVYPDIIYGNPLNAKRVVRWFLYHNRYAGETGAFGQDDMFMCYRPVFNDSTLNPSGRCVFMSYYDLDTYKQTNFGTREGKCYVIRKGAERKDLPKELDGVVIDDLPEVDKVEYFNKCKYCISYDTQTAYSAIAALCGCISVVIPEPGKMRQDYLKDGDVAYGVAYGFDDDELIYADNTRSKVLEVYEYVNASGKEETKRFVEMCIEYFKLS